MGYKATGTDAYTYRMAPPQAKYYFYLANRPVLVLKGEQGFVGYKAAGSAALECNKASAAPTIHGRPPQGVLTPPTTFRLFLIAGL